MSVDAPYGCTRFIIVAWLQLPLHRKLDIARDFGWHRINVLTESDEKIFLKIVKRMADDKEVKVFFDAIELSHREWKRECPL